MKQINFYNETDVALQTMRNKDFGLLEAATGTGKGVLLELDANERFLNKTSTLVIVGHRILLTQQLNQRVVMQTIRQGNNPDYKRIGIHSGTEMEYDTEELAALDELNARISLARYPDELCATHKKLKDTLIDSHARDISNLVYVTYHSLWKFLKVAAELNLEFGLYCDEIHTAAGDKEKWKHVKAAVGMSSSAYAFSATVDKYRKKIEWLFKGRIYHLPADKAISLGLICKPVWMIAEVDGSRKKNVAQGVVQAYGEHQNRNPQFYAKAIVNCKDTNELKAIAKSKQIAALSTTYNDFMLAHISSEFGHRINNGPDIGRLAWIKAVKKHAGHLMVLHIDICNTGIDIPEFNLPIWTYMSQSETYSIQGNGRGGRLSGVDRPLLEQGILTTADRSKWIKPYNTICLLVFTETLEEDQEEFVEFILRSRASGFEVNDLVIIKQKGITKKNPFKQNNKSGNSSQDLQAAVDIALEKESLLILKVKIAKMNPMDAIDFIV